MGNHRITERWTLGIKHPVIAEGVESGPQWCLRYTGSATALIAAGLVRREWLPGEPGCPTKCTFTTIVDERKLSVRHAPRRQYQLDFQSTEAEREAREQRDQVDRVAKCIAEYEAKRPATEKQYLARAIGLLDYALRHIDLPLARVELPGPDWRTVTIEASGGFGLPKATRYQLGELLEEAKTLLRDSPVEFDASRRSWEREKVQLPIARADPQFAEFLSATCGVRVAIG